MQGIEMSDLPIQDKAFKLFMDMKKGEQINIKKIAKNNPDKFIQYGKNFIEATYKGCFGEVNYEFSNDYKFFRRVS